MNILDNSALRECTSCQLCATVCSKKAITISLDNEGFYRPIVELSRCVDCGLCTKVCYKFEQSIKQTSDDILSGYKLYSAWANSDAMVKDTTSGGIGDLLANELWAQGYKVVGCVYNESLIRAEHRIAKTEEQLIPFRGSKYIQSFTYDALQEVVATCRNEKYAVFGTPCQIFALSKIAELKKVRNNFVFVDLYCHGCPPLHIWTKYQDHIKTEKNISSFDKVEFRSKAKGWGTFCVSAYKGGKRVFSSSRNLRGFYELFFCDQILNEGCNSCKLRGTLEYTDIRLGDFWGKKFLYNTRGVSAVSVVTSVGADIFEKIKPSITHASADYSEFLPYQSWGQEHHPNPVTRKKILDGLQNSDKTIMDIVNILHECQPLKKKVVRYIKNILAILPLRFSNCIKKHL